MSTAETENLFQEVFVKSKEFVELFCSLGSARIGYNKTMVTPYMHALVYHVPMFLRKHGSLKQFTGQGVEKTMMMPNASFIRSRINGMEPEMFYYTNIDSQLLNNMKGRKESILNKMMSIGALDCGKQKKKNSFWQHTKHQSIDR